MWLKNHGNGNSGLVFVKVKPDTMKGDSLEPDRVSTRESFFPGCLSSLSSATSFPQPTHSSQTATLQANVSEHRFNDRKELCCFHKQPLGDFFFLPIPQTGAGYLVLQLTSRHNLPQIFRNSCPAVCRKHFLMREPTWPTADKPPASL